MRHGPWPVLGVNGWTSSHLHLAMSDMLSWPFFLYKVWNYSNRQGSVLNSRIAMIQVIKSVFRSRILLLTATEMTVVASVCRSISSGVDGHQNWLESSWISIQQDCPKGRTTAVWIWCYILGRFRRSATSLVEYALMTRMYITYASLAHFLEDNKVVRYWDGPWIEQWGRAQNISKCS